MLRIMKLRKGFLIVIMGPIIIKRTLRIRSRKLPMKLEEIFRNHNLKRWSLVLKIPKRIKGKKREKIVMYLHKVIITPNHYK